METKTKKVVTTLSAIALFIGIAASVWGVSSHWHGYKAKEMIHEKAQDEKIIIAMNQSNLAKWQQRSHWLEQRIWEIEKEYKCPQCSGVIKKTYDKYLKEYSALQKKIERLLGE